MRCALLFVVFAHGLCLGSETILLLDEHTVAAKSNLTQRFFPAAKHPSNPVMRRTEKWEGVGPYVWGNRLMLDEKTGDARLWYIGYDYKGNYYRWGYATSKDGLHWTKPNLGIEKLGNELASNCLPLGPHPEKGTRSIARDPRPETPSHRRYLGVRFTYEGEYVSFSPDGIAWLEYPLNPAWFVPSDIIHVMWDEARNRYTAYYKVWELRGTRIENDGSRKPFLGYFPWYNMTNRNEVADFAGPQIHFRTNAAAEVKQTNFVLLAVNQGRDDGGGTSLSGSWTAKRVQAWAESDDGIHWKNEQVVLRADREDPPTSNIQFMFVIRHGGYYLGFLTMHDEAGAFRIQLAWSRDGLQWNRTWREPWLDIGPQAAFDSGMVLGPADPMFRGKEMWFPYGGFPIRHDSPDQNWESAIGLATIRTDGFSAWEAGSQPGELVTQPFKCTGDLLFLNADASAGSVRVEVMENNREVKGFEAAACKVISNDTLADDPSAVQWKKRKDLRDLRGKNIQLRITMQNARLFSFRMENK
jgi:hypothetical protein